MDPSEITSILPLLIPLFLLEIGLLVWALIDVIKRKDNQVTFGNRIIWMLVIVLFSVIGPIIYFIFGRKEAPTE